jgi:hypothetical protein
MNDNLLVRKALHVSILKETHAEFRVLAFKKKLSMQTIVEALVSKLVNGDPALAKIVDKIAVEKKEEELRKVIGTDAKTVYDILEALDTMKEG